MGDTEKSSGELSPTSSFDSDSDPDYRDSDDSDSDDDSGNNLIERLKISLL